MTRLATLSILPAMLLALCLSIFVTMPVSANENDNPVFSDMAIDQATFDGVIEHEFYISAYDMYAQQYALRVNSATSAESLHQLFSQVSQCGIAAHARAVAQGLEGPQLAMACGGQELQFD